MTKAGQAAASSVAAAILACREPDASRSSSAGAVATPWPAGCRLGGQFG